jgi:uncharacterized protein (UPF0332 family)
VTAQDALARHRLDRARGTFREADLLVQQGHYNAALNRLYYAAFYAARAVLALHRADSSKHSGVIALFQRHVVKAGTISENDARVLPRAFARRLETDYGDFNEATEEELIVLRAAVETFMAACDRIVGSA